MLNNFEPEHSAKVVVAMSGGVDSSACAFLVKNKGFDVTGVAMKTHNEAPKHNRACCTPDDMRDARRVAEILDIPFYVVNYADLFKETIIEPFANSYQEGKTPNPCVECNDKVKFRPLLQRAELLGADYLATGHYAKILEFEGRKYLGRGDDPAKDQSYFLFKLNKDQLQKIWFPLGHLEKPEVRDLSEQAGLPTAQKNESQEICFVGEHGYTAVVEKFHAPKVGNFILAKDQKLLGTHKGIHHYTIGQRRGLGLSYKEPLYVLSIDPENNNVYLGEKEELLEDNIKVENIQFVYDIDKRNYSFEEGLMVQCRYRGTPYPCSLTLHENDTFVCHFPKSFAKGSPGQSAVLYLNGRVIGGGSIALKKLNIIQNN